MTAILCNWLSLKPKSVENMVSDFIARSWNQCIRVKRRFAKIICLWLQSDIYIAAISSTHNVCAKDYYVAIVSTIVETSTPELELDAAYKLIGPIHDKSV
jgi:hypothetical protein